MFAGARNLCPCNADFRSVNIMFRTASVTLMKKTKSSSAESGELRLGTLLGRNQAFGLMAARCSAADAETLRQIRDERAYRAVAKGWVEFCNKHLGMSHTHANRIIGYLEEFGHEYFEIAQFTGISPESYRSIAGAVRDHALHHDGQVIALLPENTEKLARAVEQMRQRAQPSSGKRPSSPAERVAALEKRLSQLASDIAELARMEPAPETRRRLAAVVIAARQKLERLSLELGPPA